MKINLQYLLFISTIITFTDQTNDKKSGSRSSTCVPRNARLKEKQDDWRNQVLSTFHKYDKTKVYEPNPVEIIEIMKRIYDEETTLASTKLRRLRSLNDSMIEGIPFIGDFMPFDIDDLGEDFKFRVDDVTDGRNYSLALEIKELQRYMRMVFERFQNNPYRHLALDPAFVEFRFVVGDKLDSLTEIINYLIFGKGEIDKDSLLHLRSLCEGTEGITNIARYMHNRITQDCQDGKDHLIRVESSKALLNAKDLRVFRDNGSDRKMKSNDTKTRHKRGIDDDSPTTCLSDAILKVSKFEYKSLDRLVGMIGGDLGRLRLIAPICTWAIGGQNRDLSRYLNQQIVQLYLSTLDYLINDFSVKKGKSQGSEDYQVKMLLLSAGAEKQMEYDFAWRSGEKIFDRKIMKLQKDAQQLIDNLGNYEVKKYVLMMPNDLVMEDDGIVRLRIIRTSTHNLGPLDSVVDASYFRSVILRRPRGKELEEAEAEIREIYEKNEDVLEKYIDSIDRVPPEHLNEGIAKRMFEVFGSDVSIVIHFYHRGLETLGQFLTHPNGSEPGPLKIQYHFSSTPCEYSMDGLRELYDMRMGLTLALLNTLSILGVSPGPMATHFVASIKETVLPMIEVLIKGIFPFGQTVIQIGPVDALVKLLKDLLTDPAETIAKLIKQVYEEIYASIQKILDVLVAAVEAFFDALIGKVRTETNEIVDDVKEEANKTFSSHNITSQNGTYFDEFNLEYIRFEEARALALEELGEKELNIFQKIVKAFFDGITNAITQSYTPKKVTPIGERMMREMLEKYFGKCGRTAITVWISPKME